MKIRRTNTLSLFNILASIILSLNFSQPAQAMITRSVLHDATSIFNRSMRLEPLISRSFSRYAKFDGEKQDVYIARAKKLRERDNEAWSKALKLRSEYNSDWNEFLEKYFPKPNVTNNSYESSNRSISYSGGGNSSHTSDTNGFLKGWIANDISSTISGSKSKTNTETSSVSSESAAPSAGNSSHSNGTSDSSYSSSGYSNVGSSSDWDSGGGGDDGFGD